MNTIFRAEHGRIELVVGNIVEQTVDAIVNAANSTLAGGGGVDGAIHRAAGPSLLAACLELPEDDHGQRCPTGDVRVTHAGQLPARWVIHAVGPVYSERRAQQGCRHLHQVHERALAAAVAMDCASVAFPAISTGAYRFPIDEAAPIALGVAREHLRRPQSVELIRFVLFRASDLEAFGKALAALESA